MYQYAILIILVCDRMPPHVIRMYSYSIRMSLDVLVCHPYVTRMYLYVIRMSTVCTCMTSVYHSYVALPWTWNFWHRPLKLDCEIPISALGFIKSQNNADLFHFCLIQFNRTFRVTLAKFYYFILSHQSHRIFNLN